LVTRGGRVREAFWEPRKNPLIFFAVAYLFGLSINLASARLGEYTWLRGFLVFVVPSLILLVILSPLIRRIWPFKQVEPSVAVLPQARPSRGLVVFASPGSGIETAKAAVRYHTAVLEHVWVVSSELSRRDAREMTADWVRDGRLPPERIHELALSDHAFDDPESVRDRLEAEVFADLPEGLEEPDVMIDLTGGKKTTSAGAFMAGLPPGRRLQMTSPKVTDARGRGLEPGEPFEISVHYKLTKVRPRRKGRE
jgi:hypothetical protein